MRKTHPSSSSSTEGEKTVTAQSLANDLAKHPMFHGYQTKVIPIRLVSTFYQSTEYTNLIFISFSHWIYISEFVIFDYLRKGGDCSLLDGEKDECGKFMFLFVLDEAGADFSNKVRFESVMNFLCKLQTRCVNLRC